MKYYTIDDVHVGLSPYVWKRFGTGSTARIEATMPGAYVTITFQGSTSVGVNIDATDNQGCPLPAMPVIEYCVDNGPFKVAPLTKPGEIYTLSLAEGLSATAAHRVELFFRAADLSQNRWYSSRCHLRLAGVVLDGDGMLLPVRQQLKTAIGFGDSIFEGVGVDGFFASWQKLEVNNARGSWFPIVCSALGCEYGQLGSGGQGMVNKTMEVPPLPQTWNRHDAQTSRLTGKMLLPEPDYVFCAMGTNDFRNKDIAQPENITEAYTDWLTAVREACPHSLIFCVVPPLGWHREEIEAAATARNRGGDKHVFLIDTAPVKEGFSPAGQPSRLAYDGVHPSGYGNALLAALIAAEVQKIINRKE